MGPEDELFHAISAFVTGEGGDLYVADGSGIRRFDSVGNFQEQIARPGQGPTEVRHVVDLALDSTGILFALDPANRRVNSYSLEGALCNVFSVKVG